MSIWKKVQNIWRQKAEQAEDALSDTGRDVHFAIQDAENEIQQFTGQIRTVRQHTLGMEKTAKDLAAGVEKMGKVAAAAAKAGNEEDVRAAIEEKNAKQRQLDLLTGEIKTTNVQYQKLLEMKRSREAKIRAAKGNQGMLVAKATNAKILKQANEAKAGFGSTDALGALDVLAKQVDDMETEAAATEELAEMNTGSESLVEKYETTDVDTDDEVAKMMAAAKVAG